MATSKFKSKNHYKSLHPDAWDFNNLFNLFLDYWDEFFSKKFDNTQPKALIHSIKTIRNQIAH